MVLSKIFCLTGPKNFVREPFCVSKKIPVSKIFMHRRWGHHGIVEKSFFPQDRNEKLGKGTLLFSRKFMGKRGGITVWLSEIVNVSEIVKISDTAVIRTRTYRFRTLLS